MAGGMPLTFMQEDFLVLNTFYSKGKSRVFYERYVCNPGLFSTLVVHKLSFTMLNWDEQKEFKKF